MHQRTFIIIGNRSGAAERLASVLVGFKYDHGKCEPNVYRTKLRDKWNETTEASIWTYDDTAFHTLPSRVFFPPDATYVLAFYDVGPDCVGNNTYFVNRTAKHIRAMAPYAPIVTVDSSWRGSYSTERLQETFPNIRQLLLLDGDDAGSVTLLISELLRMADNTMSVEASFALKMLRKRLSNAPDHFVSCEEDNTLLRMFEQKGLIIKDPNDSVYWDAEYAIPALQAIIRDSMDVGRDGLIGEAALMRKLTVLNKCNPEALLSLALKKGLVFVFRASTETETAVYFIPTQCGNEREQDAKTLRYRYSDVALSNTMQAIMGRCCTGYIPFAYMWDSYAFSAKDRKGFTLIQFGDLIHVQYVPGNVRDEILFYTNGQLPDPKFFQRVRQTIKEFGERPIEPREFLIDSGDGNREYKICEEQEDDKRTICPEIPLDRVRYVVEDLFSDSQNNVTPLWRKEEYRDRV